MWTVLAPGTSGQLLQSGGAAANPSWVNSSSLAITSAQIDAAFGGTQGDILYRNATVWTVLAPGTAGQILQTNGAAANPAWVDNVSLAAGGVGDDTGKAFEADGINSYPGTWVAVSNYTFTDGIGNVRSIYLTVRTA